MATVDSIVGRTFRTYLEPPHLQPAVARLSGAIDADDTSLTLTGFQIPEDEDLIGPNTLLELDYELVEVLTYDEFTGVATIGRGALETTPVAHSTGARVKLSPPFSRQSVYEQVADNIISLYPKLYTVRLSHISTVQGTVAPLDDTLGVEVIAVYEDGFDISDIDGRIVDHHPLAGGRAVIFDTLVGSVWVQYRRRFGSVTAPTNELENLGVDPRWVSIVMAGAAADMMAGADIAESHVKWVGAVLKAENIRVGTRASLAGALGQYRDLLLERAASEMRAEYRATVQQVSPMHQGSPW